MLVFHHPPLSYLPFTTFPPPSVVSHFSFWYPHPHPYPHPHRHLMWVVARFKVPGFTESSMLVFHDPTPPRPPPPTPRLSPLPQSYLVFPSNNPHHITPPPHPISPLPPTPSPHPHYLEWILARSKVPGFTGRSMLLFYQPHLPQTATSVLVLLHPPSLTRSPSLSVVSRHFCC